MLKELDLSKDRQKQGPGVEFSKSNKDGSCPFELSQQALQLSFHVLLESVFS